MRLEADRDAYAGRTVILRGDCPLDGAGTVELVCSRDRFRSPPPVRSMFQATDQSLSAYDEVYREANNRRWTKVAAKFVKGPFQMELPIPEEARGPCYVRVALHGDRGYALGATKVFVRRQKAADAK